MKTLIIITAALLSFSAFASHSNKCVINSTFFDQYNTQEAVETIAEILEEKGYTFERETEANMDTLNTINTRWNLYTKGAFFYTYSYLSLQRPNGRKFTAETNLRSFSVGSYDLEKSFKKSVTQLPDCKDLR